MSPTSMYIGRVVAAIPYANGYVVDVYGADLQQIFATAAHSGSSTLGGHRSQEGYLPGAYVVVLVVEPASDNHHFPHLQAIILNGCTPFPQLRSGDQEPSFGPTQLNRDAVQDFNSNPIYQRLVESGYVPYLRQDRSYNRLLDAAPGDWAKINALGGHFLLSDYMASFGAAPDVGVRAHQSDKLLELVARQFNISSETVRREYLLRGISSLLLEETARTVSEGLGALSGAPFTELDDEENPRLLELMDEDNQKGFFRHSRYSGGLVDGVWQFSSMPPPDTAIYTKGVLPVRLTSTQVRDDGVLKLRAAREVSIRKTINIRAPLELEEPRTQTYQPLEPREVPSEAVWETLGFESEDQLRAFLPLVYDDIEEEEDLNRFYDGMVNENGIWVLPTRAEMQQAAGLGNEEEQLPPLPNDQAEYTLEDLLSVLVEWAPGRQIRLFKSSSSFIMADDGGITISDGFGAGLRMHRGNLQFFSAADMEFNPGRDMRQRVGRNWLVQALNSIEHVAETGSIRTKAETDLHMTGGAGGQGSTVLENRAEQASKNEISEEQLTGDEPRAAGVVIKSRAADLQMLASTAIYMGGYVGQEGGQSKDGLPESVGVPIYLHAGRESISLFGNIIDLSARDAVEMTLVDQVCFASLRGGAITNVAAGGHYFLGPGVNLEAGSGSYKRPVLSPNGVKDNSVRLPTQKPQLLVQGQTLLGDILAVNGQIQTTGGVAANGGINGGTPSSLTGNDRVKIQIPASTLAVTRDLKNEAAETVATLLTQLVDSGLGTAYGHKATDFAFPDSVARFLNPATAEFRQLPWQIRLQEGTTWVDAAINHGILSEGSRPYPGLSAQDEYFRQIVAGHPAEKRASITAYTTNWQRTS